MTALASYSTHRMPLSLARLSSLTLGDHEMHSVAYQNFLVAARRYPRLTFIGIAVALVVAHVPYWVLMAVTQK